MIHLLSCLESTFSVPRSPSLPSTFRCDIVRSCSILRMVLRLVLCCVLSLGVFAGCRSKMCAKGTGSGVGALPCVTSARLLLLSEAWLTHLDHGGDHRCTGVTGIKELAGGPARGRPCSGAGPLSPHCPQRGRLSSNDQDGPLLCRLFSSISGFSQQRSAALSLIATTRNASRHPSTSMRSGCGIVPPGEGHSARS